MRVRCHFKKRRWIKALCVILVIVVLVTLYISCVVNPLVNRLTYAKVQNKVGTVISTVIIEQMTEVGYQDLVEISYNSQKEITGMQYNAYKVNRIAYEVTVAMQDYLNDNEFMKISLPSGAFTGLAFLSQLGADVRVEVETAGYVDCRFVSDFRTAGINQTVHRIFIVFDIEMHVILPLMQPSFHVYDRVLCNETVIVGKVPEVYANGLDQESILDLIPDLGV